MRVTQVPNIEGAVLFEPTPHRDERGYFCRTSDSDSLRSAGIDPDCFVQDSVSRSARGVVRGLHLRSGAGEAKLVRCSFGAVFDVVIDLRPKSVTYLKQETFELSDRNQVSVYVPAGCAHGFQALSDPADVTYRINRVHDPADDLGVVFNDPQLAIRWPLSVTCLSARDQSAPCLAELVESLARKV